MIKRKLGVFLLKVGAKLTFDSESQKQKLKDCINSHTQLYSHIESGGHIHGYVKPMCDYDTQSVVNVLTQGLMLEDQEAPTTKEYYYSEKWNW